MRFINRLYDLYRDHLTGDEEDLVAVVVDILQDLDRQEMIRLMVDMDDEEIYQMLGMYLVEMLRIKVAEDGAGHYGPENFPYLH